MKRISFLLLNLLLLAGLLSITGNLHAKGYTQRALEKDLQLKLIEMQKKVRCPGVTASIVLPDGKCISLAAGLSDIEKKIPMKPTDRIFMGSVGKTYVAPVVLQLVEEKKISLKDKLSGFLGKEKWYSSLPNGADITLEMLLSHTGGVPRYIRDKVWADLKKNPDKVWKPEELIEYVLKDKPVHPAGKGWHYSDTGFVLLGMVVEKVTGNRFYEELTNRILRPHKFFDTLPADKRKLLGLVPCYTGNNVPPILLPSKTVVNGECVVNPQFEWTGGGLLTTTSAMARYFKELLEGKILSPKYVALMKQAHDEKTGQRSKHGYGFGLEVYNSTYGISYGHRGTMIGCRTIAEYVPKYGFSIALQINADTDYEKLDKKLTRFDYINFLKPLVVKYLENK